MDNHPVIDAEWLLANDAFWERVDKTENCWLWKGKLTKKGYGVTWVPDPWPSNRAPVHRIVYHCLIGPIPDGFLIRQACRVSHCLNPEHLRAVARKDLQELVYGVVVINAAWLLANKAFWGRVEKTDTCWLWKNKPTPEGYGTTWVPGDWPNNNEFVHRLVYHCLVGPIHDGLVVHHICKVKHCLNPEHLKAVTQQENIREWSREITHCPAGHEYTEENTYWKLAKQYAGPSRRCRTCNRLAEAERRRKKKQEKE